MAKAKRLTVTGIERVKAPVKGRDEYFDSIAPGLHLRVSQTGHKSWAMHYHRYDGKHHRLTLGPYPVVGLEAARERVREIRGWIAEGLDPKDEFERRKNSKRKVRDNTVEAIGCRFLEEYCLQQLKPRTAKEYQCHFEKYIFPLWGSRPIAEIEKGEVVAELRRIAKSTPVQANRIRSTLSKFFNWSEEEELVLVNPVVRIKPFVKEADIKRDRVLSDKEIASIWTGLESLGWPFGPIGKLLFLTGERRTEVAGMEWSEVDLEAGVWNIPKGRTKNNRPHDVPLSTQMITLLESLPKLHDRFVFPSRGRKEAEKIASGFSKAKTRLDKLSEVTDWRLHDLRRTLATEMAGTLGIDPHIVEAVLNHVSGHKSGVAGVYNRATYLDRRKLALQAWANRIDEIVHGADGNVVMLHG
jgi:integrase